MHTFMIGRACQGKIPKALLPAIRERFDVVPRLGRHQLAGCGPVADTVLEFSPGLNVVCGSSGSGKTLLLEAIKKPFASPPPVTKTAALRGNLKTLSTGQLMLTGLAFFVEIMPPGSCLLADDTVSSLNDKAIGTMLEIIQRAPQVVLALSPGDLTRLLRHAPRLPFMLFSLFRRFKGDETWTVRQGRWGDV